MVEVAGAAIAGTAAVVSVLALGGMRRQRAVEDRLLAFVRARVAAEAERSAAAGVRLGGAGMVAIELLVAIAAATLGYLVTGMPALAGALAAVAVATLVGVLAVHSRSRRRERQDSVVAAVRALRQLLATGAVGVSGALEVLAQRGPESLRREFEAILAGGSRPAAWAAARRRVGEPVFDMLSAAILVQRPGGGELGPLFRELEESVTAIHEVEREAAALQVQARSASTLILCLPLAFLAVMCLLRSPYLDVYRTLGGQLFLAAMLAVMGAAHLLIRRWLRLPDEPRLEVFDG